ncbi:MAG: hypothetical protein U0V04_16070 [Spirosomataceae bacterium]|jgi:hypothetical protein
MKTKFLFLILAPILIFACQEGVEPVIMPGFSEIVVSEIGVSTAKIAGSINDSGNQDVSDHGFVYAENNPSPTITDFKVSKGAIDRVTPTPIDFSETISNLKINSEYHIRAYAQVGEVTVYGESVKFKTLNIIQPGIKTVTATAITHNTASMQGAIESKGTYDISEYGIVLSSSNSNPTVNDTKLSKTGNISSFPSSFSLDATNLQANTTYNYRAYVISNGVTTYGSVLTFKTLAISPASVITDGSSNITFNSATLSGKISSLGTLGVSEYGFVYSVTNQNPSISDTKVIKSGTIGALPFAYSVGISNLTANTIYYFRAYVINNGVAVYGSTLNFKTSQIVNPVVSTLAATSITYNSATMRGNVVSGGSFPITEHGICYSASNNTPVTTDSKLVAGGNVTSFPKEMNLPAGNLSANTTYYFRAYVVSNGITIYGSVLNFKTSPIIAPTVSTQTATKAANSANVTLYGTVNTQGAPEVSEYGFVWSDQTNNPNITHNKIKVGNGIGSAPFRFTTVVRNFTSGRTNYYRAYVIAGGVTYYGNVLEYFSGKD